MAIALDASTPAGASQTSSNGATVVSPSFSPPAGSVVYASWQGNTGTGAPGSAPTITDSLGTHLPWQLLNWRNAGDSGGRQGQAALWRAVVTSAPGSMTITVTTGSANPDRHARLKPLVLTGVDTTTPETANVGEGSDVGGALDSISVTSAAANSWLIASVSDWDVSSTTFTAASGTTVVDSATPGGAVNCATLRNTTPVASGSTVTLGLTSPTSTTWNFVYAEVQPASGGTNATPTPTAVAGVAGVGTATVQTGSTTTPAAVAAVAAVPAVTPSVGTSATPTPSAVAAVGAVPNPTVVTGSTTTPAAVAAVAAVPSPTVDTGAAGGTEETFAGTGFPSPGAGGSQDLTGSTDSTLYVMGVGYRVLADGTVTAVRHYVPTAAQPTNADYAVGLWLADPAGGLSSGAVLLTQQTATAPGAGLAGTWYRIDLDTPQDVTSGQIVYPVVRTNRYAFSTQVFAAADVPGDGADLEGVQNSTPQFPNGAFQDTGASTDPLVVPANSSGAAFYGIDLVLAVGGAGADATPTPSAAASVAAVGTATLTASADVAADAVAGVGAVGAPTLLTGSTVAPAAAAAVAAVGSPTVATAGNATPTPAAVAAVAAVGTPTLLTGSKVTPSAVAAVAAVPAPTVQTAGNATSTPATVAGAAAVGEFESVSVSSTVMPDAVAAVAAVGSPTVQTAGNATPTPAAVAAIAGVAAPTVQASSTSSPAAVAAVAAVPSSTVQTSSNATPTPAAVAAVAAVGSPAVVVGGGATAPPNTVAAVAAVGAPTVQTGSRISVAAVAGTAAVPAPTVLTLATPAPAAVVGTAAIGAPTLFTDQHLTQQPVAAVASVPAPNIPAQRLIGRLAVGVVRAARGMTIGRMRRGGGA